MLRSSNPDQKYALRRSGSDRSRASIFFSAMDYWILVPVMIMVLIGLYVLNQVAADGVGTTLSYPSGFYRQVGAVLLGLALAIIICLMELPTLRLFGSIIYIVAVILLIYVKIDGYSLRSLTGADSWIRFPVIGSLQPSELAKTGIAMVAGNILAEMKSGARNYLDGGIRIALVSGFPLLLIITEPDFGTSMTIVFMVAVMIFVWGIRWRYVLITAGAFVIALPLIWNYVLSAVGQNRILTFLFPGHDKRASYHISQSLSAVSSGGITGSAGQPVNVPVKESDFIFSAVAEYMGLIGVVALIALVAIFIIRTLFISFEAVRDDPAQGYIMTGLISVMAFHYIENMGMTVGMLPITGIPLPFVSHGGSAMVSNFISLGIILNISMNQRMLAMQSGY
ncbi:MAG: FtsW/RodA/SpoVE family cell cycle protein [Saccharofermentanales bacterium]|jgi:rod shape determining protein RodA|nr:FtsW/RodA/SpoVE family cell cycle protein [Bacillota bacterium]